LWFHSPNKQQHQVKAAATASDPTVVALAEALMNPNDNPAIRIPNLTGRPTAACTLTRVIDNDWSIPFTISPTLPGVPEGHMVAYMFRDLLRSMIVYNKNPTNQHWGWNVFLTSPGSLGGSAPTTTDTFVSGGTYWIPLCYASARTDLALQLTDILYAGECSGRKGLWLDGDAALVTNVYITLSAYATHQLVVYQLVGTTWQQWNTYTWSGSNATLTIPITERNYYAFELRAVSAGVIASIQVDGICDCFVHHAVNQLGQFASALDAGRVVCDSLLWTNTGAQMFKSGEMSMFSAPAGQQWMYYTGSSVFGRVASQKGARRMDYLKGGYGFDKVDDPSDLRLKTQVIAQGGTVYDYKYDLCQLSSFEVYVVSVLKQDGAWPDGHGLLSATHAVEFTTNSQVFDLRHSPYTDSQFNDALKIKAVTLQFHENYAHLLGIARAAIAGARALGGFVWKHIGKIASAAALANEVKSAVDRGNAQARTQQTQREISSRAPALD